VRGISVYWLVNDVFGNRLLVVSRCWFAVRLRAAVTPPCVPHKHPRLAKLSKNESRQGAGSINPVWRDGIAKGKENQTLELESDSRNGRLSKKTAIQRKRWVLW